MASKPSHSRPDGDPPERDHTPAGRRLLAWLRHPRFGRGVAPQVIAGVVAALALVLVVTRLHPMGDWSPGKDPGAGPGDVPRPTLFGASVHPEKGESYRQAVDRSVARYGRLQVIRRYYVGMPPSWKQIDASIGGLTPIVSFNADAEDIIAGRQDAYLKKWFASAPRDRTVYWCYFHEPENDIEQGKFTAAQFREAWRHIDEIADGAHNDRLVSTLSLMTYTLRTPKRDWHDYFPGKKYVDVFGWDRYDTPARKGQYGDPAMLFDPAIRAAEEAGVPFAFTEMGSKRVQGDPGDKRARWLDASAHYLADRHAVFVSYFDSTVGGDFRLLDKPSQQAWRNVVTGRAPWQITCPPEPSVPVPSAPSAPVPSGPSGGPAGGGQAGDGDAPGAVPGPSVSSCPFPPSAPPSGQPSDPPSGQPSGPPPSAASATASASPASTPTTTPTPTAGSGTPEARTGR